MQKIALFPLFLSSSVTSVAGEWVKLKKDTRLPLELRVVNEGLAHDDSHWYLSNQHFLYQTSIDPANITNVNHQAIPPELAELSYNHIGDIDVMDGFIYGGLEDRNDGNGVLAAWDVETLTMVRHRTTEQRDFPWVAVNPETKDLWSSAWDECCTFNIWDRDTFELIGNYQMPDGIQLPPEIQGGAFYKGDLYLATNVETAVWKLVLATGELTKVLSDAYPLHNYEMEGLDFWDLTDMGLGEMHLYGNFMQVKKKAIHHYEQV